MVYLQMLIWPVAAATCCVVTVPARKQRPLLSFVIVHLDIVSAPKNLVKTACQKVQIMKQ